MDNIEEKFYKTFGIKKQKEYGCTDTWDFCYHQEEYPNCKGCPFWELIDTDYPPITDRILLELICIVSDIYPITINCRESYKELKEFILGFCLRHTKEFDKKQVRSLFEREVEE